MRRHLFEWMDQPWLPGILRDAMRRYLSVAYRATPLPEQWARALAALLDETGEVALVDLGSGADGPVGLVLDSLVALGQTPQVTLTDLYPVDGPSDPTGRRRYWPTPVDARAVPPSLQGVRTLFAVFHHFAPADARTVLRDAFEQRQSICVFEGTSRTPVAIASSLLIPLLVLVMMPAVRPRSALVLCFTYLVPVLPLLIFWDGLVSHLRTYTAEELRELTSGLDAPDYHWSTGYLSAPGIPIVVPYLTGRCVRGATDATPSATSS